MSHRQLDYRLPIQTGLSLYASDIPAGDRKLVIILPVDTPSSDLCKVIASAVALGYPAPILVNWKKDFHTDEQGVGPSHLGKVTGTLDFLEWAEGVELHEDDLVVMLDAHDVWLQLPPEVLLERYFKSVQQANRRLFHDGFKKSDGVRVETIVSAQKGCFAPRDPISNLHCDQLPESILSPNIYGLFTDSTLFGWNHLRPRYVNSGSFMGPVGNMKRYFRRVKDTMDKHLRVLDEGEQLAGDQGVFSEVFGEQEVWRQRFLVEKRLESGEDKALASHDTFEYHVGLDYTQELFYPTCYSERDGYFVALGQSQLVEERSGEAGVTPPRVHGVPKDIEDARSPLAALGDIAAEVRSWGALPLYTDFWTTAVPVAVHHNAWKNGLKSRRTTWWDQTWYFPYLRRLIEANSAPARHVAPLAALPANNGTLQIWASDAERPDRKAMIFGRKSEDQAWGLHVAEWASLCHWENETREAEHPWYDEVFRDGKGAL